MKTFKSVWVMVLLSAFVLISAWAKAEEFKKVFQENYASDNNTTVSIDNRFGEVVVKDWEKNSVDIKVVITVKESNEEKANKIFEKIKIALSKNGNDIKGITETEGNFNNVEFSIDYEVNMPADLKLTIENRYGDVFVNKLTGILDITVKYGNFKGAILENGKTEPKSQLVLEYSKGTLTQCNWLKLILSYSQIEIDEGKALMIVSKYSKFKVIKSSSIVVDSKYDGNFSVGEVNNFVCDGKYTNYKLGTVREKLVLNTQYSNTSIENMPAGFESIEIVNEYGNITIGIPQNASYTIDGLAEYGSIKCAAGQLNNEQKQTTQTIKGKVGNGDTKSNVNIRTKYGNATLN